MSDDRETFPFKVTADGVEYDCKQVVTGNKLKRQEISVFGVGSKVDSAKYGPGQHPISTMDTMASTLALEILNEDRISKLKARDYR